MLYDGHKSHSQLTLTDLVNKHNVILFVLPPHSSHLTQPLDVGVYNVSSKKTFEHVTSTSGTSMRKGAPQ